ncbi:Sirohydrochlorin cobaltochelatase [Leptospira interrogans serovar Manilae]|uniref:Sirohydrochlorin cobaltochelatase n=1 Tax=Leptospira interrogans serovar Manilae TaxID=214675 RepID=A0AAQ1SMT1_LEPIR|nr:CbiX/SirB N-terminal domain-containing protein [Leptospira interrogans]AKP28038.1 ferredoxin [Leptospira interrogans serovar Manilae]AKP31818.1 ferredoxin [Leptospira interrogans serovar Manilae]EMJ57105.1 sirohydrochlorin cobaltochelatase [Leptospira interrogans serovar Valbuzzi str. Duyster]ENO71486.1 sirohydrochlorin cobaltochelatase [Leptospira interrogans serovar Valbuzzi str. Valbuzzi]EYU62359.1 ferredoxin [Leptospira interrogans serovar Manilae]
MNIPGILIIGHGSRESSYDGEFEQFVQGYHKLHPEYEIKTAYVELSKSDVKTALRELSKTHNKILIFPLFLFASNHVKNDISLILSDLKREFINHQFISAMPLGIHRNIINLLHIRSKQNRTQSKTGVIVVGRGASDADSNGDFYKAVRFFEESSSFLFVKPSFIGITKPLLQESLEMCIKLRPEHILILPYFLFYGKLIKKIYHIAKEFSEKYPWIKIETASHFGPDPTLYPILDERISQALSGTATLPCDNCEYRVSIPGLKSKVGGLNSLLWSMRHLETHTQAAPHEFPHRNFKKHIFVCDSVDCVNQGSISLIHKIRSFIRKHGRQSDFRVSKSSCLGRCGEGPTVVIYPDGIWYQRVSEDDAKELVDEHLFNDRLVTRLVDNIM